MVWHMGLIVKLHRMGIPNEPLKIIVSWLESRKALVLLGILKFNVKHHQKLSVSKPNRKRTLSKTNQLGRIRTTSDETPHHMEKQKAIEMANYARKASPSTRATTTTTSKKPSFVSN
ncbi:unnamed protein product [Adineta steineri]|uniref:Uncharacterized protein n=1 Tax=Adineta steineri TaxID=433720 RepID=A0A814XXS0_9BILA|nr:unnamed protein product [Adineta steineri]CAF1541765.1 unnamed protein product [Adineta steineri]